MHICILYILYIEHDFWETGENPLRTFASKRFYLGNAKVAALEWLAYNHAELNLRYIKVRHGCSFGHDILCITWLIKIDNICTICLHSVYLRLDFKSCFNCSVLKPRSSVYFGSTRSTVQALQAAMQRVIFGLRPIWGGGKRSFWQVQLGPSWGMGSWFISHHINIHTYIITSIYIHM